MKKLLFSILVVVSFNAKAQTINIKPDMVVSKTDFDINEPFSTYMYKANMIIDEVKKDNVDVYVVVRGFVIWGLHLNISDDGIKPEYYRWDDGGGHQTHLDFDSYELSLNANKYKIGDRMLGRFKGTISETRPDGEIIKYTLKGKFVHIIQNTKEVFKAPDITDKADLSRKTYRNTGLYYRMDPADGLAVKAPTYELVNYDDEYYLYSSPKDLLMGMENFTKALIESDPKKQGIINIKLKIEEFKPNSFSHLTKTNIHYGLIIDDKLWYVGDGLIIQNDCVIFPLKIKKDKATELVGRLNFAIQKGKNDKKTLLYKQKHPE